MLVQQSLMTLRKSVMILIKLKTRFRLYRRNVDFREEAYFSLVDVGGLLCCCSTHSGNGLRRGSSLGQLSR